MKFHLPNFGKFRPFHKDSNFTTCMKILGDDRVMSWKEKSLIVGSKYKELSCDFDLRIVEQCAEANHHKHVAWHLLPKIGWSFVRLREQFPDQFCPASVWYDSIKPPWLASQSDPRFLLLNLQPVLCNKNVIWHERVLSRRKCFARVKCASVAECLIAAYKKWGIRYLSTTNIIGEPIGQSVPLVGEYDETGMLVCERALDVAMSHYFSCETMGIIVARS